MSNKEKLINIVAERIRNEERKYKKFENEGIDWIRIAAIKIVEEFLKK